MTVTAIDLFCGVGGFSRGLHRAGIQVLGAVDAWDVAVRNYNLNNDHPAVLADARNLTAESFWQLLGRPSKPVDLVVGGPPCQGFSIQRIGEHQDDRNDLIFEFGRLVQEFRPRLFLMENVPGLLGQRGKALAEAFVGEMTNAGYIVKVVRVNTADYGVPQIRKRIFVYGWDARRAKQFVFPSGTFTPATYRTVEDAIGDLAPLVDRDVDKHDPLHRRTRLSALNQKRLELIPPGGGFEDLPVELRVEAHKNGASKIGHRNVYGRLAPDKPAVTITARFDSFTRGKFAHPLQHRNISLREGARLQSFDDDFTVVATQEEAAALIGNAVPPLLAEIVGRAVVAYFEDRADEIRQPLLFAPMETHA